MNYFTRKKGTKDHPGKAFSFRNTPRSFTRRALKGPSFSCRAWRPSLLCPSFFLKCGENTSKCCCWTLFKNSTNVGIPVYVRPQSLEGYAGVWHVNMASILLPTCFLSDYARRIYGDPCSLVSLILIAPWLSTCKNIPQFIRLPPMNILKYFICASLIPQLCSPSELSSARAF